MLAEMRLKQKLLQSPRDIHLPDQAALKKIYMSGNIS
jgi:hypothetical protein